MNDAVAVLDVGKTNVKLCVVRDGRVVASAARPNAALAGTPYPHHDLDGIWEWLLDALRDVARAHPVGAVVPVTHGATAVLMAGDRPALPCLDYEHPIPEAESRAFDGAADPFAATLSPRLPAGLNLGRQLFWQRRAFPDAFASATQLLLYPQYWAWRLTGVGAAEVTSLGCHTGLWRPLDHAYAGLVERQGWHRLMPPLARAWDALGPLRSEVLARTGLDPSCRVLTGLHDSNASYLRHLGELERPFTVVSTGTWTVCMAAGGSLDRLAEDRDTLANVDVTGAPVPCARFMGGREHARILDLCGAEGREAEPDDLLRVAGSETFALPSFAAQGGPWPKAPGRVEGDPHAADAPALAALYLALMTDHCLAALGASGPIVIEGSMARNTAFAGALAGLRPGQPVLVSDDATGTVLGAASLVDGPPRPGPVPRHHAAAPPLDPDLLARYRRRWRERVAEHVGAAVD